MNIDAKIEALLFYKAEPLSVKKLAQMLEVKESEVKEGLSVLEAKLEGRGITLMFKDNEVMLGTHSEMGKMIESLVKDELSKDVGKAGLETLSVILYRGPIAKSRIDYVRGVNSGFILRNLLVRGLIEKVANPKDQRASLYRPTFELLSYLGVSRVEDLPEFAAVKDEIGAYENKEAEEKVEKKAPEESAKPEPAPEDDMEADLETEMEVGTESKEQEEEKVEKKAPEESTKPETAPEDDMEADLETEMEVGVEGKEQEEEKTDDKNE